MRFDIFSQSTGRTLFTLRGEFLARFVTWLCRGTDYVEAGCGWLQLADVCVGYSDDV